MNIPFDKLAAQITKWTDNAADLRMFVLLIICCFAQGSKSPAFIIAVFSIITRILRLNLLR